LGYHRSPAGLQSVGHAKCSNEKKAAFGTHRERL
jgi:hypothetical protein